MHAEIHYLFRHAVMREVAYQLHVPSSRASLHALVLQIMEQVFSPEDLRPLALELADHAREASEAEREANWLRVAADHAREGFQNALAISVLERLAAHPSATDSARIRVEAARLALLLGRPEECERLLPEPGADVQLRVDCLLLRVEARVQAADYRPAADYARQALELARAEHLREAVIEARVSAASVVAREGRVGEVRALCEALLPETVGLQRTRVKSLLAGALMHQDELEPALELYSQAEAEYQAAGDLRGAMGTRGNMGHILRRLGRVEEGLECYRHVDREARRTGDQRSLMIGLGNLGNAFRQLKRFDEALEHMRQAEAMARELGDPHAVAMNVSARGNVLYELGRLEEALDCFRLAEAEHRRVGSMHGLMTNAANRGTTAAAIGRYEEAVAAVREALGLMRSVQMRHALNELSMREVLVRSLQGLGRQAEAREAAREAEEWLAGVNDERLRQNPESREWIEMIGRVAHG